MSESQRRVEAAARDAVDSGPTDYDEMEWDGDMLVPRSYDTPLDRETPDERAAGWMGPTWEPKRKDEG